MPLWNTPIWCSCHASAVRSTNPSARARPPHSLRGDIASENLQVITINNKSIQLDPLKIKWIMIVHFDSDYGAFTLDSWCGWIRESGRDYETCYLWKPDADLPDTARGCMLNLGLRPLPLASL